MPNIEVAANGVVNQTVVLPGASLDQLLDADGSSIMTITDEGTNRKGEPFSQLLVFDRQ